MSNLYLYFSGTGNTLHVIEKFATTYEETENYTVMSIEYSDYDYSELIKKSETITIAYPIHDSMMPFIMSEFLKKHLTDFENKEIIVITTQLLFSGDGAALAGRLLRKAKVKVLHTIHINMPNNLTDLFIFKKKPIEDTIVDVEKADLKIEEVVDRIKSGKTIRDGRKVFSWFLGFFTQRVWGIFFLKKLRKAVKIDQNICILCNKCVEICPIDNLYLENNQIKKRDKCTLCYRCVNACPEKAISIFSKKKPIIQYIRKDYN